MPPRAVWHHVPSSGPASGRECDGRRQCQLGYLRGSTDRCGCCYLRTWAPTRGLAAAPYFWDGRDWHTAAGQPFQLQWWPGWWQRRRYPRADDSRQRCCPVAAPARVVWWPGAAERSHCHRCRGWIRQWRPARCNSCRFWCISHTGQCACRSSECWRWQVVRKGPANTACAKSGEQPRTETKYR